MDHDKLKHNSQVDTSLTQKALLVPDMIPKAAFKVSKEKECLLKQSRPEKANKVRNYKNSTLFESEQTVNGQAQPLPTHKKPSAHQLLSTVASPLKV